MKNEKILYTKDIFIVYAICIALLIVGTFLDEVAVTHAVLANNHVFCLIANYVSLPFTVFISVIGMMMIANRNCQNAIKSIGTVVLGLIFVVLGILFQYFLVMKNVPEANPLVHIIICSVIHILSDLLVVQATYHSDTQEVRKAIEMVIITALIALLLGYVMNQLCGRTHYFLSQKFEPWYTFKGFTGFDYYSFPSMYMTRTSIVLLLPISPIVFRRFRYAEREFLYLSFILVLVLGVIRVISGYDYISSVAMSIIIFFTVEIIAIKVIYGN